MSLVCPSEPQVFERGDKIYFTAPVQGFAPTEGQIEEYAFASQVKKTAPNENLLWLKGQYVEAEQANLNGAMWRAGEISLKHLTPMLMPVTVMHDPRTAVGTIADVALRTPEQHQVPRARLETILALWEHRFPEVAAEVKANLEGGSLMQSMECFSPWYECSDCGMVFHKQPRGAERAQWCDHLKAAESAGGVHMADANHQTVASRILGDVCFTGTGLIFGTRGAKGALPSADLSQWQDEVAEIHQQVHTDTARTARSTHMGLVQIEESELKLLREERDSNKKAADDEKAAHASTQTKLEEAEAAKTKAEEEKAEADKAKTKLEEDARSVKLKDDRFGKLGDGFLAKLGENTRARLEDQAKSYSDDDWEARLSEVEELTSVKRDAKKDGSQPDPKDESANKDQPTFESEEVAAFVNKSGSGSPSNGEAASRAQATSVVGSLTRSFRPQKPSKDKS